MTEQLSCNQIPTRCFTSFDKTWDRFCHPPATIYPYSQQYSNIYTARLKQIRPRILERLGSSKSLLTNRIIELVEGKEAVVIGTIVKEKQEEEIIILEDESGRVELDPGKTLATQTAVTGIVVGVRGRIQSNGVLLANELFNPLLEPATNPEKPSSSKVLFLSGLKLGSAESTLSHSLLIDYIAGHLTEEASLISRVIIAGESCCEKSTSMLHLDMFLSELLASGIPITLVPGTSDPTNANFPNQPIHPCLLPNSSTYKELLDLSPNPFEAKIDNHIFLGTDGCNIRSKINPNPNELFALEQTLKYSHMAPNAPDTLGCFPYIENDPFVIEQRPHIYFAGNCEEFATKEVDGTTIICLPKFAERSEAVILDLSTRDFELLSFRESL